MAVYVGTVIIGVMVYSSFIPLRNTCVLPIPNKTPGRKRGELVPHDENTPKKRKAVPHNDNTPLTKRARVKCECCKCLSQFSELRAEN